MWYSSPMSKSRLQLASLMRGLYRRVADKLGVDPSYVSRVARGERRSPQIEASLKSEVSRLLTSISGSKAKVNKR
jgi:transcriptional regulator with XRE-family HTH domain